MNDEKRIEGQICYLNESEMNDPNRVLKAFVEDVSLDAVRDLIVTMRKVCSTTENVTYDDPKTREDLFYVTDKMIRFFEASFIEQKKITVRVMWERPVIHQLRVIEKPVLKNVSGVPNTVPCIMLYGKWLATAGFHPGKEITVITEQQKMYITTSREWNKQISTVKARA